MHPKFADNDLVYLSYAEAGDGDTRGAAVARAKLELGAERRQAHRSRSDLAAVAESRRRRPLRPSHRVRRRRLPLDQLRRSPEIRSGAGHGSEPRQDRAAQRRRLVPRDNPFADRGGVTAQIWSLGHRNPLGLAFDPRGASGTSRWARWAATSSISCSAARTTVIRSSPTAITTTAKSFPITTRGPTSRRPRCSGIL